MSIKVFNPCCQCEDFIDIPVKGSFTALANNQQFNDETVDFIVDNLSLRFSSTSSLFSGITLSDLNGVRFKPLAFSANRIIESNRNLVVGLVAIEPVSTSFNIDGELEDPNPIFITVLGMITNNTINAYGSISVSRGPTLTLPANLTGTIVPGVDYIGIFVRIFGPLNNASLTYNIATTTNTINNISLSINNGQINFGPINNNDNDISGILSVYPGLDVGLTNFVNGNTRFNLYNLYAAVLVDIIDTKNVVIAKALLELIAVSPVTVPLTLNNVIVTLNQLGNVNNITGYFEGFITLTGNGLLNMLPTTVSLNTLCSNIDNSFKSLMSSVNDLLKRYGNRSINHTLYDVVITIPSMILTLSEQFKNACGSKCKQKIETEITNIINKLNKILTKFPLPSNTSNSISFDLSFTYEVNKMLSVLNRLLDCQLENVLCHESSSDSCEVSNDKSSKNNDSINVIIQKLSGLESTLSRINQVTNETRQQFNQLQHKVAEQDKIIKKVTECVIKK
jgi:hypothetical protein